MTNKEILLTIIEDKEFDRSILDEIPDNFDFFDLEVFKKIEKIFKQCFPLKIKKGEEILDLINYDEVYKKYDEMEISKENKTIILYEDELDEKNPEIKEKIADIFLLYSYGFKGYSRYGGKFIIQIEKNLIFNLF